MKKLFVGMSLMFIIILLLLSFSGCKGSAPNESDIKSALQTEDLDGYWINNLIIEKSQIDNNVAQYWCIVELENETYLKKVAYELVYEYYDTGGWIIEEVSDVGLIDCNYIKNCFR